MKVKETEVFIVVSSLTKDMNSKEDMFRSNALKVLAKIIDPINVGTIDRSMKTVFKSYVSFIYNNIYICIYNGI